MKVLKEKIKRSDLYVVLLVVVLAVLPQVINSTYIMLILSLGGIYVIAASGLDVMFGYCGQISLGHAAFYAIGAYGSGILSKLLGLNPWLTILLSAMIAAVIGFLFALPISKLQFMFLSLVTIGFGEIVYQIIVNFWPDITGSTSGFKGIPKLAVGSFIIKTRADYFYVVLMFVVILILVKNRIIDSKVGRAFISIRENAEAAGSMGINVKYYKAMAFAISAFYVAIAGALYGHMVGFISPETFKQAQSVMFLTMVLLGGRGTVLGPIMGAMILVVLTESVQSFGQYQRLIYGAFIVLVVLFMPKGLAGVIHSAKKLLQTSMKKGGTA